MSEPKTDCNFIYRIHSGHKQQHKNNKVLNDNKKKNRKKRAHAQFKGAERRSTAQKLRNEQQ